MGLRECVKAPSLACHPFLSRLTDLLWLVGV